MLNWPSILETLVIFVPKTWMDTAEIGLPVLASVIFPSISPFWEKLAVEKSKKMILEIKNLIVDLFVCKENTPMLPQRYANVN